MVLAKATENIMDTKTNKQGSAGELWMEIREIKMRFLGHVMKRGENVSLTGRIHGIIVRGKQGERVHV